MWSEFVTPEIVGSRIWPRTAAIAERLWSPKEVTDVDSMYRRLAVVSDGLAHSGQTYKATHEQMLQRMAGANDVSSLKILSSAVEPPKEYARESLASYDSFTPLNRMVDTVPPESNRAREFNRLASLIAAGKASPEQWEQARAWLVLWRDNDAKLQPILPHSDLTAELAPVSHTLNQTAVIGLSALDSLQNHKPLGASVRQQQLSFLKSAEAPQAVLLDMVVPSVELLLNATTP
jgi:hexosaminidase